MKPRDYKSQYPDHVNPVGCDGLVNQTGVGKMLGVKQATVAMWISRHQTFPTPVIIPLSGTPLWDALQVQKWYETYRTYNKQSQANHNKKNNK